MTEELSWWCHATLDPVSLEELNVDFSMRLRIKSAMTKELFWWCYAIRSAMT